jgi:hypothetical protein
MKVGTGQGIPENPIVNARRCTISGRSEEKVKFPIRRACLCCSKKFRVTRPTQRFCSSRCRLLFWAAREIVREYEAGNAAGLREMLERLKH